MPDIELSKQELLSLLHFLSFKTSGKLPSVRKKIQEALENIGKVEDAKQTKLF